ncbi:MAG: sigma-70 family RNA polymerase sigma factor [Candidatus Wallbacteria bacterium]|nr:sigma-70 family RNA polymerase sigma factor [Candidatus Wallbacteria bacterium]
MPLISEFVSIEERREIEETLIGSPAAFARLMKRHQKQVAYLMWRFTRNREDLEELVHDIFVEAFQNLRSFRGESSFLRWLKTIAYRTGYRYWKKNREIRTVSISEVSEPGSRETETSDMEVALYSVLEHLPARERLIMTLHYFEGYDMREISIRMGWSYTLIRVSAFRARKKIKQQLEKAGFGGEHEGNRKHSAQSQRS